MNLFIMDVENIITHYKPQTEEETYIIDAMKWLYEELNDIKDVLSDYSLSYDHVGFLDKELEETFNRILRLDEENDELKHEISYLKGDLDQLKKDF